MQSKAQTMLNLLSHPGSGAQLLRNTFRAFEYARKLPASTIEASPRASAPITNPLRDFFEANRSGPGIWKWTHYFDAYHRHLSKFVGREVHILEIGIYSGGSLKMWRDYFGPGCHIYGVDIEPACKKYENAHTKVFIGDQADRSFWANLRKEIPKLDIVIDDGGHEPEQQIVTLEETLWHLTAGGVYMCEDIHGTMNAFVSYLHGLSAELGEFAATTREDKTIAVRTNRLQSHVSSIHHYPFLTVIERTPAVVNEYVAPKHGTEWQPFL